MSLKSRYLSDSRPLHGKMRVDVQIKNARNFSNHVIFKIKMVAINIENAPIDGDDRLFLE